MTAHQQKRVSEVVTPMPDIPPYISFQKEYDKIFFFFRLAGVKAPEGALRAPSRHGSGQGAAIVFARFSNGFPQGF